jgi:hypothetical protein
VSRDGGHDRQGAIAAELSKVFAGAFPFDFRKADYCARLPAPCRVRKLKLMVKSSARALSSAKKHHGKSKSRVQPVAPADQAEDVMLAKSEPASERPRQRAAGVRLWGFVRRQEDVREKTPELLPQDIVIWYDNKRCRFEIVSDQTVVDDLAPVEFVQFVRALQYSTTQILFKFENRHDGSVGRPVCVWLAPLVSGAPSQAQSKRSAM